MMRPTRSKVAKMVCELAALFLLGAQVVRPAKTNPVVDQGRTLKGHIQMSGEVAAVLKRACNDCHSNETEWPWYSDVAPVSWFVIDHVNHGRRHLNFSDWARYDHQDANKLLRNIARTVEDGDMPLGSYTLMHREARLTQEERRMIVEWALGEQTRLAEGSSR